MSEFLDMGGYGKILAGVRARLRYSRAQPHAGMGSLKSAKRKRAAHGNVAMTPGKSA
jgi:hypothetical protein